MAQRKSKRVLRGAALVAVAAEPRRSTMCDWLVCAFLVVSTAVVYGQVYGFGFVNYDDTTLYVTENVHTQAGLSWKNVVWAFSTGHASNWHPLTWLSLMLDVQLFGVNAGAMHLVNLLLHVANSVLLFLVLRRMTANGQPGATDAAFWPSVLVAALFALHPLHVESVAWISERKDVLSGLFWMLTMAAYLRYTRRANVGRYSLVAIVFLLGLMAKPMLVTLPAALLLLDYWPLRRLDCSQRPAEFARRAIALIGEKIPLFLMAVVSSIITFYIQQAGSSVATLDTVPLWIRLGNAVVAYARYLLMTVWPAGLAVFYPHPGLALSGWQVALGMIVLSCTTIATAVCLRRAPYLIVGWLWFLGTLLPVIGIVQVGSQALADRYTYIPSIGLFIIIAWGTSTLATRWRLPKKAIIVAGVAVVAAFSVCTAVQTRYWRNSTTLFERALQVTSRNFIAHDGLGVEFLHQKRYEDARLQFIAALEAEPRYILGLTNLGTALAELGRYEEAKAQFIKALEREPRNVEALNGLGSALRFQGRPYEAEAQLLKAIQVQPHFVEALVNLGITLADQGRYEDAKVQFMKALAEKPRDSNTLNNLGAALFRQARYDEAGSQFMKALEVDPNDVGALSNLGAVMMSNGHPEKARQYLERALQIDPNHKDAGNNLDKLKGSHVYTNSSGVIRENVSGPASAGSGPIPTGSR